MSAEALDYLKKRVVSTTPSLSGDVTTTCKLVFDNGVTVEGTSIRNINGFSPEEAQEAAYNAAILSLIPGVDFVLSKQ